MSGLATGDVRDLLAAAASGNQDARIALDVFTCHIRKFIGQFLVELNGADVLVFTAGIAENHPGLRWKICANLDFCGLELDEAVNASVGASEAILSTPRSKIEVRVIPTNEELIIARDAWRKLSTLN
jgi:acetate kinase